MADLISVRDKAINAGKQACQYDKDQRYEEALKKYIDSIEYFQHLLKCTWFSSA
jgi:hypothetical protein